MNAKFQDTIAKRKEETYERLERLNERITNMDMYFEDEKMKILKYIDDRGEELARLLYKFKVEKYHILTLHRLSYLCMLVYNADKKYTTPFIMCV